MQKKRQEENHNMTEIAEGRLLLIWLCLFCYLVFRQGHTVCMGTLSLMIVKTNSLAFFYW